MILGLLIVLFVALVFLALLTGFLAIALLTVAVGLAFRSSRYDALSTFLIWIPGLGVAFAASFITLTVLTIVQDINFIDDPHLWFATLIVGEILSLGLGLAVGIRINSRRNPRRTDAAISKEAA